jgi:AcrR family transcriptional regulator
MEESQMGGAFKTRSWQKAERRQELLSAATRLFAEKGFRAVSIDELGASVGISGPAVYRHFPCKEDVLVELLVGVSKRLLDGGTSEASRGTSALDSLQRLVSFQTDFALKNPDLIRIQDRDLCNVPLRHAISVRRLQRAYVEIWVAVLLRIDPQSSPPVARTKAHAAFGLLNSTPHSLVNHDVKDTRQILERMAMVALVS